MNQRNAAALAVGLMLQCTFAFADATASASFSNVTVELIDLDPGDGLAPAVTFYGVSVAQAIAIFTPGNQMSNVSNFGATSFGPASQTSPASPWSGASGSFSGDVYAGTGTATATAWATGLKEPFGGVAEGIGEVELAGIASPTSTGFLLSPHTELIISGFADLEGEVTPGGYGQSTFSNISMAIDADTSAGPQHSGAALHARLDDTSPSSFVANKMELSVSLFNGDATSASGYFSGLLSAAAASAVPEVPTSMLLLSALAAMGIATRGRRSRS